MALPFRSLQRGAAFVFEAGFDALGLDALENGEVERAFDLSGGTEVPLNAQRTLDGGEEDEAGLYGAIERNIGSSGSRLKARLMPKGVWRITTPSKRPNSSV